jgi:hypothetical protein
MANRYQKDVLDESVGPDLPFEESLAAAGYPQENARKFALVAAEMERLGYDTFIGDKAGIRTRAEDAANKAKKLSGKLPSKHITGEAIDLRDRKIGAESPSPRSIAYANDLGSVSKSYGLGWGGDWFSKGGRPASWAPGIGWDPHHIQTQSSKMADAAVTAAMSEKSAKLANESTKPSEPNDGSGMMPRPQLAGVLQSMADMGYDEDVLEYLTTSQMEQK